MADESFKYPPGMRSAQEWSRGVSFVISEIEAIQQDAITAARREVEEFNRRAQNVKLQLQGLAANNAAHKEKVCRCVLTSTNRLHVYNYGVVTICGYCERPIL